MEGEGLSVDEQVMAVILAVLVVVGVFAGSQTLFASRVVEPFSELGVLGSEVKIGDYPRELIVKEPFTLYLYVGNREGRVMYYAVLVKLGNKTTSISDEEPMDVPAFARYEVVLLDGKNWTKPVTLSVEEPGVNYRLVFELWTYNEGVRDFEYHGRWCQLWLNVTKPAVP